METGTKDRPKHSQKVIPIIPIKTSSHREARIFWMDASFSSWDPAVTARNNANREIAVFFIMYVIYKIACSSMGEYRFPKLIEPFQLESRIPVCISDNM